MIPHTKDFPWHVQVHRDAFSYGDVGPKADPRVVVDLRFFGKQDIVKDNRVEFGQPPTNSEWRPGVTDIYGMPQATVSEFVFIFLKRSLNMLSVRSHQRREGCRT